MSLQGVPTMYRKLDHSDKEDLVPMLNAVDGDSDGGEDNSNTELQTCLDATAHPNNNVNYAEQTADGSCTKIDNNLVVNGNCPNGDNANHDTGNEVNRLIMNVDSGIISDVT